MGFAVFVDLRWLRLCWDAGWWWRGGGGLYHPLLAVPRLGCGSGPLLLLLLRLGDGVGLVVIVLGIGHVVVELVDVRGRGQ